MTVSGTTARLRQPCPSFSTMDIRDCWDCYIESIGKARPRDLPFKGSDRANILAGEFGLITFLASTERFMTDLVVHIFKACLPRKMRLGDAPEVTIPARMRCLMFTSRRGPVNPLANEPSYGVSFPIDPHIGVAPLPIGPLEALVTFVRKHNFLEEARGLAVPHLQALIRVTVSKPSAMVLLTIPSRIVALAAIWNRAYSGGSHFDLSTGWFGQGRSGVTSTKSARFCTMKSSRRATGEGLKP